jgi:hypothetical protein
VGNGSDHAAYDPERDAPGTLYGFTRDEWAVAGERYGGTAAAIVALWDRLMHMRQHGQSIGADLEALVAIARVGPTHARRVMARLEPAFSRDHDALADAISPDGRINRTYLERVYPGFVAEADTNPEWFAQFICELRRELVLATELRALAASPEPVTDPS